MADRDLVGLLTGTPTQPIQPLTRNQRLAQEAGGGGRAVGKLFAKLTGREVPDNPMEQLEKLLPNMNPENPDDLSQLAKLQMSSGNQVGAARTIAQRNAILEKQQAVLEKQELEDKEAADRISFSEYIRNKFPAQPALIQLAESGQLNPSNFKDFLNDPKSSGFLKGTTFTVQDEDQNAFTMVPAFNKDTGKIENTYSRIGTKGPEQPVGITRITGGEFALTPEGETARTAGKKGAEEQEKTYGQLRVQAIDSIPTLSASKVDLEKAEMLLNSIETGGPINIAATELEGFFGVKSADKGQLEIILGFNMMEALKPLFGGIISDQESDRLDAIYAGMSKGNPANKGILRQLKKKVDDTIFKSKLYQKTKTVEEFNTLIKQMYPEDAESENEKVTFDMLKKRAGK